LLSAFNNKRQLIKAVDAMNSEHYYCPSCRELVILKRVYKVKAHFAHRSHSLCIHAKGESQLHYQMKYHIAQSYLLHGQKVEIEPFLTDIQQYPDLLINDKFVIELQLSTIPFNIIKQRTKGLMSVGKHVIWLLQGLQFSRNQLTLTQFQSSFIHPEQRTLYEWDDREKSFYCYHHIQHLGGKRFSARKTQTSPLNILKLQSPCPSVSFKLANHHIKYYIQQCRRQNSVLEPTLSAIYQLRLSDDQATQFLGYIFPNQIYINSHPIAWQAQLLLYLTHKINFNYFKSSVKFRNLLFSNATEEDILNMLITQYKQTFDSMFKRAK